MAGQGYHKPTYRFVEDAFGDVRPAGIYGLFLGDRVRIAVATIVVACWARVTCFGLSPIWTWRDCLICHCILLTVLMIVSLYELS